MIIVQIGYSLNDSLDSPSKLAPILVIHRDSYSKFNLFYLSKQAVFPNWMLSFLSPDGFKLKLRVVFASLSLTLLIYPDTLVNFNIFSL